MQKDTSADIPDYYVYTDGSCLRNPGGSGGIGVVIINTNTGEISEYSKGYRSTTNNRMEIMAVIEALKIIPEGYTIELFSDSRYVINSINGSFSRNINTDLWETYDHVSFCKEVIARWVRGHHGDEWNERCDNLAFTAAHHPEFIDNGYEEEYEFEEERFEAPQSEISTMDIHIEIPLELNDHEPEKCSAQEYAKIYNVKPSCAKAIVLFYAEKKRRFRSYLSLKTGGLDAHSRLKLEDIANQTAAPELYLRTLREYINNEKDVIAAARWNTRGLSLYDSIRKVLVDQEVRWNM